MKKILILQGHPDGESFCAALSASYRQGAEKAGYQVRQINVGELEFDPNLRFGYRKRTELEKDLLDAQEAIKWSDHIVLIHPLWWGSVPAVLKGFIDRVFLPGFAFKPIENSLWWNKLLKGRSGRIITTMDQPGWYYRFVYGRPSINALKKTTFHFCGIKPVRTTSIGPVKNSTPDKRKIWLLEVQKMGSEGI
jgi:NAD(P)H dehydrogenase (quinone)